jgi:mannose-6-phosphate isomerase-like protein (cupin superfamily)
MIMTIRRVVTGPGPDGTSCVRSDGRPPATHEVAEVPGMTTSVVWSTEGVPVVPHEGSDPTEDLQDYFPGPGATRFMVVSHPPGSGVSIGTSLDEMQEGSSLGATMTEADGVMHATDSVDYGIVLSGSINMALDDGTETTLVAGDVVVQTGVRHGWLNRGTEPCVMAFVMVGATRSR